MTNPFSWAVNQLANVQRVERKVPTFNPRPPGVIHAGSSSEAVLQILRAQPKVFFTHGKLMELTGKSHAAVSWALKYLRKQGLVKTIGDTSRNERWLRYRAVRRTLNDEINEQSKEKHPSNGWAAHAIPIAQALMSCLSLKPKNQWRGEARG